MATQYTRTGNKDWVGAIKSRWRSAWGGGTEATNPMDYAVSNTFAEKARTAASTNNKEIWQLDADDALRIGSEAIYPMAATMNFPLATNASIVTQHFFIAPFAMEITAASCIFATADGATNTGFITHETGAQAPGTGATIMNGTFNLNATAATVQNATLWLEFPSAVGNTQTAKYSQVIRMAAGDRLSFKIASAVTSLAGLVISIAATPGGKGIMAVYNMQANGDLVDQHFFLSNSDYTVSRIDEVHSTLGTNGSAVTVDVKKCTGTQAAASGTTLLSAVFSLKTAINTVQNGALTATAADLRLAPGNRLAVDFTGTLTAVAGVVVVVLFMPCEKRKEVTFTLSKNANQAVDQYFFIADRRYDIICVSEVHAVAAGGASKIQVTRDTGTDAPGAGTDLIGLNSAAGFDLAATAETVQVCQIGAWPAGAAAVGFVDPRFNVLRAGDRLAVDYSAAAQSTAGVTITVSLRPS